MVKTRKRRSHLGVVLGTTREQFVCGDVHLWKERSTVFFFRPAEERVRRRLFAASCPELLPCHRRLVIVSTEHNIPRPVHTTPCLPNTNPIPFPYHSDPIPIQFQYHSDTFPWHFNSTPCHSHIISTPFPYHFYSARRHSHIIPIPFPYHSIQFPYHSIPFSCHSVPFPYRSYRTQYHSRTARTHAQNIQNNPYHVRGTSSSYASAYLFGVRP